MIKIKYVTRLFSNLNMLNIERYIFDLINLQNTGNIVVYVPRNINLNFTVYTHDLHTSFNLRIYTLIILGLT